MVTWSYIAGFIDCDGWVTKSNERYGIGLTQVDKFEEEMKLISSFLIKNKINHVIKKRISNSMIRGKKSKTNMINIFIGEQQSLKNLCIKIKPYSLIKKDKVQKCLDFCSERLNKRGITYDFKSNKKRNYWSSNEIKILKELHSKGYSNKAIAIELNRNKDSVSHKLYRLSIKRKY